VELPLFDEVAEAVRGLLPPDLGPPRIKARRYGLKAWFGERDAPREHYEAQVISPRHVDGARVLALEVGFHAEHREVATNDDVLTRLAARERAWRRALGREPVAGPFLGRPDDWRRISETWLDPDLDDPGLPLELAARLVDYIAALEPLRRR
jgi:hypothetical protein